MEHIKGVGSWRILRFSELSEQSFYFFRNDGLLFEWEQTSDTTAALTQIGTSTPSNDNDGASCGNTGLEAKAIVIATLAYNANGGSGAPVIRVVMRRVM